MTGNDDLQHKDKQESVRMKMKTIYSIRMPIRSLKEASHQFVLQKHFQYKLKGKKITRRQNISNVKLNVFAVVT